MRSLESVAGCLSLLQEARQEFGSCNWIESASRPGRALLPVPAVFELRAMGEELATGEAVSFLSGFWFDGSTQTHQARVKAGQEEQVWRLGANSGRWYS